MAPDPTTKTHVEGYVLTPGTRGFADFQEYAREQHAGEGVDFLEVAQNLMDIDLLKSTKMRARREHFVRIVKDYVEEDEKLVEINLPAYLQIEAKALREKILTLPEDLRDESRAKALNLEITEVVTRLIRSTKSMLTEDVLKRYLDDTNAKGEKRVTAIEAEMGTHTGEDDLFGNVGSKLSTAEGKLDQTSQDEGTTTGINRDAPGGDHRRSGRGTHGGGTTDEGDGRHEAANGGEHYGGGTHGK